MTWIIASAMTGVAGILLSPLIQLDAAQYTTLSVAALSVALVGRFRSLVVTALAGVGLGVAASLITGYAPGRQRHRQRARPGAAVLPPRRAAARRPLARRRPPGRRRRCRARCRSARSRSRRGPGRRTVRRVILAVVAVGLTVVAMFAFDDYWTGVFAAGMSFAVIFLGFTVSTGEGGILCLGQAGFAAAGAFVAGRLATRGRRAARRGRRRRRRSRRWSAASSSA